MEERKRDSRLALQGWPLFGLINEFDPSSNSRVVLLRAASFAEFLLVWLGLVWLNLFRLRRVGFRSSRVQP